MNQLVIAKLVVSALASAGAGTIVGNAVKHVTPATQALVPKVTTFVGGLALGSIAADAASTHAGKKVDEAAKLIETVRAAQKKTKDN